MFVMTMFPQHVVCAPFAVVTILLHCYISGLLLFSAHCLLPFNSLTRYAFVPFGFLSGIICPIVKDNKGDFSSVDNCGGLTLSYVFSFLLNKHRWISSNIILPLRISSSDLTGSASPRMRLLFLHLA